MPIPDCTTGPQPSRTPGNIGTLKSKVMIWDNDPFWARPTQNLSWQFSKEMFEQTPEDITDVIFELGAAYLRPTYKYHDMFVCTLKPVTEITIGGETTVTSSEVDFVGSQESGVGQVAQPKLPGGIIYFINGNDSFNFIESGILTPGDPTTGKDIFPHQVWRQEGSLVTDRYKVLVHPSEYKIPLNELESILNSNISIPLAPITIGEIKHEI